jgi:formate dehydrogenase iron-sulfur subunit
MSVDGVAQAAATPSAPPVGGGGGCGPSCGSLCGPPPGGPSGQSAGCAPSGAGPCGPAPGAPVVETLIDRFLAEQGQLTAVERFSRYHDAVDDHTVDVFAPTYVELLPVTPPGPGQQYAFEVDLDACTGCKACVTACHSLNGLAEGETWRSVGLLIDEATQQHVTAACHHCVDPGCLAGCPADA